MKRLSIIALCAAAVVAAACQKEIDIPEVSVTPASEPAELELNIEVIMQQVEATKVHKTDWEVGDNLYIIFDKTVTNKYLNIYYTRNWSEGYNYWEAYWTDGLAAEIVTKGSGTLSAFYVPYWKTIGLYPHYDETHHVIRPEDKVWIPSEEPQPTGKPVFSFYMICDDVPYTVSDGKLNATLNMAPPAEHNFVHFFLPGEQQYESDPRQFILTVVPFDDKGAIDWGKAMTSVTLSGYYPETGFTTTRRANIPGYYYYGGVSFCGTLDPSLVDVQRDYLLFLSYNNNTPYDTSDDVIYRMEADGKTLRAGSTVELKELSLWAVDTAIQAIPMYKNDEGQTVCFADRNLFADEGFCVGVPGIYTAWGGWAGTTAWNLDSYWFNWNNYPYGDGTSFTKYSHADGPWALEEEDDAAKMFHGYAWSTPTMDEWTKLVERCDWTWKDISAEPFSGYYGYIVTGRGEFSSSSIFLPAADFIGYDDDNSWTYTGSFGKEAESGAYWAKELSNDKFGSCFTFMANSLPHTVTSWMKNCGFCVRPVMIK